MYSPVMVASPKPPLDFPGESATIALTVLWFSAAGVHVCANCEAGAFHKTVRRPLCMAVTCLAVVACTCSSSKGCGVCHNKVSSPPATVVCKIRRQRPPPRILEVGGRPFFFATVENV